MKYKEYVNIDNQYYYSFSLKRRIKFVLIQDHWYLIKKYLKYLRKEEWWGEKGRGIKILSIWFARKKNKLGNKLGFYISPYTIEAPVTIWHNGSIIINGNSSIGKNCVFHGNNCIGNDGANDGVPNIGDNVEFGFGSSVIGEIYLANGTKIGAGAVVVKSYNDINNILVGIPAKRLKANNYKETK